MPTPIHRFRSVNPDVSGDPKRLERCGNDTLTDSDQRLLMDIGRLSRWALCPQHALVTLGCFPAYPRSVAHDQGVILVEQLMVVWKTFHEHLAQPAVMEFAGKPPQSLQQTVGVGINDETRFFGGVQ